MFSGPHKGVHWILRGAQGLSPHPIKKHFSKAEPEATRLRAGEWNQLPTDEPDIYHISSETSRRIPGRLGGRLTSACPASGVVSTASPEAQPQNTVAVHSRMSSLPTPRPSVAAYCLSLEFRPRGVPTLPGSLKPEASAFPPSKCFYCPTYLGAASALAPQLLTPILLLRLPPLELLPQAPSQTLHKKTQLCAPCHIPWVLSCNPCRWPCPSSAGTWPSAAPCWR